MHTVPDQSSSRTSDVELTILASGRVDNVVHHRKRCSRNSRRFFVVPETSVVRPLLTGDRQILDSTILKNNYIVVYNVVMETTASTCVDENEYK